MSVKNEKILGSEDLYSRGMDGQLNYLDYGQLGEALLYIPPRTEGFLEKAKRDPKAELAEALVPTLIKYHPKIKAQEGLAPSQAAIDMNAQGLATKIVNDKTESLKWRVIAGAENTLGNPEELKKFQKLSGLDELKSKNLLRHVSDHLKENDIEPVSDMEMLFEGIKGAFISKKKQKVDATISHEALRTKPFVG